MPELGTYGSVRGALSNGCLYRDCTTSTAELKPRDMIDVQSFIWCIDPNSY
jgi:hypothetical protein